MTALAAALSRTQGESPAPTPDEVVAAEPPVELPVEPADLAASSGFWDTAVATIDGQSITPKEIAIAVALLVVGTMLARVASRLVVGRLMARIKAEEGATAAVTTLVFYLLVVVVVLTSLRIAHVPLTAFTLLGGAAAIGIGFGSQNLVNNFLSGLVLLVERPIRVGDLVQVGDLHGNVAHVGARSTVVRTGENVEIIVPNSRFLDENVVNWTRTSPETRVKVAVGVAYGSPTDEVARRLRAAVDSVERVHAEPEPIVLFSDFGNDALLFEVHFWIRMRSVMDRRTVTTAVRFAIDAAFREAGVVIAFPQRDVHLDTLSPLDVRVVSDAAAAQKG